MMIALPSWASMDMRRWISDFAPTSMPRVGSSIIKTSGTVSNQREISAFCWLPPERFLISWLNDGVLMRSFSRWSSESFRISPTRRTPRGL